MRRLSKVVILVIGLALSAQAVFAGDPDRPKRNDGPVQVRPKRNDGPVQERPKRNDGPGAPLRNPFSLVTGR